MLVQFEEGAYGREVGQEEEVKEVDVQCASADVLQAGADEGEAREVLRIVAEVHEYHCEENELCQCAWQIGPCHAQVVPLQYVHGAEDHYSHYQRIEPAGVHDALCLLPVAAHYVAEEEEWHVFHQLYERGIAEYVGGEFGTVAIGPPEEFGHVAGFVYEERK